MHGKKRCAWRTAAACLAAGVALFGCGGGGGGAGGGTGDGPEAGAGADSGTELPQIVASRSVAGRCAAPRVGTADRPGSLDNEKRWVRAWIDETYLWYDEVPSLRAADYATPVAYFNDLKTPALTASGRPKDRFHFSADTATYEASAAGDAQLGYGIQFAYLSSQPPRDVRVAYVGPGSPADQAGVRRGMRLLTVDGLDVARSNEVDALNAALAPTAVGEQHRLGLGDGQGPVVEYTLSAAQLPSTAVMNVRVLPTSSGPVGYLQFNEHSVAAEAQLMDALGALRASRITDLVLDMRYNGGGLLGVAAVLGSMVAPANSTRGQTFERLIFNRKNPFGPPSAARVTFPDTAVLGPRAGESLPRLNLPRVLVLAGGATCSASESVVNGLRGIGVRVDLVGATTCGKPYGFFPEDNCGTTYFAVQFQGVNARGEGDYGDGMAPTCAVPDDFDHALGDPAEARLAAALTLRSTGLCPGAPTLAVASAAPAGSSRAKPAAEPQLLHPRPRLLDDRIVRPQDLAPQ